jgi:uncharacterized protein (TIGR02453 family)
MAQLIGCPGPTPKEFPGFCPQGIALLRGLKRRHRRQWFQERQEMYDQKITTPLLNLVCTVSREFARFAPDYVTVPDKAVFRMYGDVPSRRDQAHKTPAAIWVRKGTQEMRSACFYFHFTDREAVVLGGVYHAEPADRLAYRTLLRDNHREFQEILSEPKLQSLFSELQGEKLRRMPAGFWPNHPAAELIRRKQWYLVSMLDMNLLSTPRLLPSLVNHFEVMAPLVEFLNRPFAQKPTFKRTAFAAARGH